MTAAPSSCRVSTKRMSLRPYISVTMLLVVVPTTPNVWSTPSARRASTTARPAFICAMGSLSLRMNDGGRAADDERLVAFEKIGDHLGERFRPIAADGGSGVVDEDKVAVRNQPGVDAARILRRGTVGGAEQDQRGRRHFGQSPFELGIARPGSIAADG